MRIDNYKNTGAYLNNRLNINNHTKGYENLKRQGVVKITSVDGKNMNVFFMYGESASGDIKIYTDKNNGNITLKGKTEVKNEDLNYLKEDLSKLLDESKVRREVLNESNKDILVDEKELGFIVIEDESDKDNKNPSIEEQYFKGIVFDRERIESDGKLEEYLELRDLIEKTKNNKKQLDDVESGLKLGIDNLGQDEGKLKDIGMARDLFEVVKVKIYEDKLLLSKIRDTSDKTLVYNLLK